TTLRAPTTTLFPYTTLFRSQQHHRHLDQHADHGGQRRAGMEAEQTDGGGYGQLEEVAGTNQRGWPSDAVLFARLAVEPVRQPGRSEEHTSELQSRENLVCRL